MIVKRLYDDDGHWLEKPIVKKVCRRSSKSIKTILKKLFKEGWSRIDVERMLFDHIRFESTMMSLLKIAEKSERMAKKK